MSFITEYQSDFTFQFWEYTVSHGNLLIRSPKSETRKNNTDLIFDGVIYVSLPRFMRGLTIRQANSDEELPYPILCKNPGHERIFLLTSEGVKHLIIALRLRLDINEMDIMDKRFDMANWQGN